MTGAVVATWIRIAERFLVSVETDKLRGEWVDPRLSKVTFFDWTQRWWGTVSHLKPYTLKGYESLLRVHILPIWRHADKPYSANGGARNGFLIIAIQD